jgi:HEAT repeat protein
MDEEISGECPVGSGSPGIEWKVEGDPPRSRTRLRPALKYLALALVVLLGGFATRGLWRGGRTAAAEAARMLHDGDAPKRIVAIGNLERFGQEEPGVVLPALSGSLKDEDAQVRAAAALAIVRVVQFTGRSGAGEHDARRAVAALFDSLEDSNAVVRASVLQAIWMIAIVGERPVVVIDRAEVRAALVAAAADPDSNVRLAAVRGLGAIGPKLGDNPPPELIAALADASEKVRTAAAESLAWFPKGLPRLLPSVVRSFETARPEARPAYALVLNQIRPRAFGAEAVFALGAALSSSDDEVRCLAASALGAFGEASARRGFVEPPYEAIPALASSIGKPGRSKSPPSLSPDEKHVVLKADKEFGWALVPASVEGRGPALTASHALLSILPEFPFSREPPALDAKSFTTLTEVLVSGTPEVRATVAHALGRFQPVPAVVPVLGAAVRDRDAIVRASALKALHDLGDRMPFAPPETFQAALEDESPGVRYWAAGALGHIGLGVGPYIPALLERAERDPDADVRYLCALEVQEFVKPTAVTPEIIPVLIKALDSPALKVRCAACGLLAKFGPASAPAIPRLIGLLTERSGEQVDRSLLTTTNDEQGCAAAALGRIAPNTPRAGQAAKALIDLMRSDPSPWAMNQAVLALPGFGAHAQAAIPRLRELARSSNPLLKESASQALAKLNAAE